MSEAEGSAVAELSPAVVIGTGLVGASLGCALTKAGVQVHLRDNAPGHAQVAASRGAGSVAPVSSESVKMVIVAVPPDALPPVIAQALREYPNASVTDVGSVKSTVLAALRQQDLDLSRYVGSHPMAGSHKTGPLTAHAELFVDRMWIVAPHDTAQAHAVLAVNHLVKLCGARLVTMGPAHHDEAVAQVSHLPHIVSALVAGSLLRVPAEHLRLAGQGLRDVTRIAGSDAQLWQQIIAANSKAVQAGLRQLATDLTRLLEVFDSSEAMTRFLDKGRAGRAALPGKHGAVQVDFAHVVVEIPDAPGALAKLFKDIDAAGVNVEDLSITHDQDREVGYLSVQVAPRQADELIETMRAASWVIREDDL